MNGDLMQPLDAVERCKRTGTQRGRVPDFFVVGHPKCGTTALYEMLRSHAQIFMPSVKEPHFFATDLVEPRFQLEKYLELFGAAKPGQIVGEASPRYLNSRVAASGIASLNPRARAVAIFREPATFLRSLHLQHLRNHEEPVKDLRTALDMEVSRRQGAALSVHRPCRDRLLLYSEYTRYLEQLQRYRAVLPDHQILTLIYDDFRHDNAGTVRRVLEFLGIDAAFSVRTVEANPSVAIRRTAADSMLHRILKAQGPASLAVKHAVKTVTPRSARLGAVATFRQRVVYAPPPPPDETLMAELRRRFKPEVVRLGEFLGRDLVSLWGYDHA